MHTLGTVQVTVSLLELYFPARRGCLDAYVHRRHLSDTPGIVRLFGLLGALAEEYPNRAASYPYQAGRSLCSAIHLLQQPVEAGFRTNLGLFCYIRGKPCTLDITSTNLPSAAVVRDPEEKKNKLLSVTVKLRFNMDLEASDTAHDCPAPDSTASGGVGLLGLPDMVRQDIYKRVLAVGHPIYLFQDFGPRVETFAPDRPQRWLALLYTNRQIYGEARTVLYSHNYFHLIDRPQQQDALLRSFLNCIGPPNADSLSRLCISFPAVEKAPGQPEAVKIREDSLQCLNLLQEKCTNLKTLEMQVSNEPSRFLTESSEGLLHINSQLAAMPSVEKIIIRLNIKNLSPPVADTLQGLGWVVLN